MVSFGPHPFGTGVKFGFWAGVFAENLKIRGEN